VLIFSFHLSCQEKKREGREERNGSRGDFKKAESGKLYLAHLLPRVSNQGREKKEKREGGKGGGERGGPLVSVSRERRGRLR